MNDEKVGGAKYARPKMKFISAIYIVRKPGLKENNGFEWKNLYFSYQ